jgi:periplasmic copper chaperone A
MSRKFVLFAALLLVAGAAAAQTGSVAVTDAWARATTAEIGAAYLTLQSPVADRLTGLSTPIAQMAQLHTTRREGGTIKMRRTDGLDLPAGTPVKLEPGATHIMLIGLTEKLIPGQSFPLTLTFAKAGTREVTVSVAKAGATGPEKASDAAKPTPPGR